MWTHVFIILGTPTRTPCLREDRTKTISAFTCMPDDFSPRMTLDTAENPIKDLANLLNTGTENERLNAAERLTNLLFRHTIDKKTEEFIVQRGGIPALINVISQSDDIQTKFQAVHALGNFARDNLENKKAIRNGGGITALIALVKNRGRGSAEAAKALGILAKDNIQNQRINEFDKGINEFDKGIKFIDAYNSSVKNGLKTALQFATDILRKKSKINLTAVTSDNEGESSDNEGESSELKYDESS